MRKGLDRRRRRDSLLQEGSLRRHANRKKKGGTNCLKMQLIVASLLLFAMGSARNSACAFQGDFAGPAATFASSFGSADDMLFAAANILDSQKLPFPVAPLISTISSKRKPDPLSFTYDYETQPLSSTIVLTKEEQDLFQLIRDFRDKYCPNTTLRVAGGWVRDKLLRRTTASQDVDVVVSDKSGIEFARMFRDFLEDTCCDDDGQQDVVCAIRSDAFLKEYGKRSKHLQTASLKVGDFWIDFCHLRYEKYSRESRVPEETGIASAVEDAWRRDLTINSLFYNINTNQVEDWTEQGLCDLQLRNIATPKAPLYTFMEDPLRVLRAIRFASQLSFSVDPALKKAVMDERVRSALKRKVSTYRMGNEVDSIFQSPDPSRGVELLIDLNLVDLVFPLNDKEYVKMEASPSAIYKAGFHLLSRTQALVSRIFEQGAQWDEEKRRFLWYAALFKPFRDMSSSCGTKEGGSKCRRDGSLLYQLLNLRLKRSVCDIRSIESIIKGADTFPTLLEKHDDSSVKSLLSSELQYGTLLDNDPQWKQITDLRWTCYKMLKQIGPLWRESLILALSSSQQDLSETVQRYEQWINLIEHRLGLDDVSFHQFKPLLNGSQIQKRALPGARGEVFKQIMKAQEEWQVRQCFPESSASTVNNREAALIDHLINTFPEFAST